MEFFYSIGSFDQTEILGSHLYYGETDFVDICELICDKYTEIMDEYDEKVIMSLHEKEIYTMTQYLRFTLIEKYDMMELFIGASYSSY